MSDCRTNSPTNFCKTYPDTRCVVYTGVNLLCIGVNTNDRLEEILAKINDVVCSGSGSVTSIQAGDGMDFPTIISTGSVIMGVPSSITLSSTNSLSTNSHTHSFTPGGTILEYIRGDGTLTTFPAIPVLSNEWHITGNIGTIAVTNFIGTTDDQPLTFKVNSTIAGYIQKRTSGAGEYIGSVSLGMGALANSYSDENVCNIAIGPGALTSFNGAGVVGATVAVGRGAGRDNKNGYRNVFVGEYSGFQGWGGDHNTGCGTFALEVQAGGSFNAAFGDEALRGKKQGNYNTGAGAWALLRATTIVDSVTIISGGSGYTIATATFSSPDPASPGTSSILATGTVTVLAGAVTAIVITNHGSGYSNEKAPVTVTITGDGTGATGIVVLRNASANTALGFAAGWQDYAGQNNVYIGPISGNSPNLYDTYNILIGFNASRDTSVLSTTALTNAIAIGHNAAVSTSNTMILGGIGADAVKVGIGKITATETLDVVGNFRFSGALMPNNLSGNGGQILVSQGPNISPIWSNGEVVLSTTTGINAKNIATTSLYTVPVGKTAIITGAIIRVIASSAITIVPTLGVGIAVGEDDIFSSTSLTGLDDVTKVYKFTSAGTYAIGQSADIIKLGIDVGATATTMTIAVDLIGYLI